MTRKDWRHKRDGGGKAQRIEASSNTKRERAPDDGWTDSLITFASESIAAKAMARHGILGINQHEVEGPMVLAMVMALTGS